MHSEAAYTQTTIGAVAPVQTPELERAINRLSDAQTRLHKVHEAMQETACRVFGGPSSIDHPPADRPSRAGQIGTIECQTDGIFDLIDRLEASARQFGGL